MAGIKDLTNVWTNIRQVDMRPLAEAAERGVRIALVGRPGAGKHALADQLRRDPSRPQAQTQTPLLIADLEEGGDTHSLVDRLAGADLVILLVRDEGPAAFSATERALARAWSDAGLKVLVLVNHPAGSAGQAHNNWIDWDRRRLAIGPVNDHDFLVREFAPQVMDLLPEQQLALGRFFPLFRVPIANRLINETCFSNATYSLSTGLAEIVPVLDIPLNLTDMVVLSKNQAFLVYKLGLALGLSTRWQDYVADFGSVLGSGFLWRQAARSLVGLVPAWGIIPKVAIAYSGTYVVGHVVVQWYLTGRHLSAQQMRQLYSQAFTRGKNMARQLTSRLPRPKKPRLGRGRRPQLPAPKMTQVCANCGRTSAMDAQFCQYCGHPFARPAVVGDQTDF
jgi:uncharacterized protein (DUF697 family)